MKSIPSLLILVFLLLPLYDAEAAPTYPLQASPDGREIVDHTGRPVFINMESAWFLLTRLTREEVLEYFDDRAAKGFNAILIMWPMPEWNGEITNRYGEAPFLVPGDFSTPNGAYFDHADWVVQQAQARGLLLFLAPAYLGWECINDGFCGEMQVAGTTVMREWGHWIGSRYRSYPNIVWVEGGDADARELGVMDLVDAVAYGIKDVDSQHLHTAHCSRYHSAAECYDRPWLDINTTYADCQQTPLLTRTNYQMLPRRPIVFIEGRYEFEYDWTDVCMRSQAYWSLLGGAIGHTFGSGIVHTFSSGWQDAMQSEGSQSMVHFQELLQSRTWQGLVPDYSHAILVNGYGDIETGDYAAAASTSDGQSILVYLPSPRSLTVSLDGLAGSTAEAWWYDPSSGDASFEGAFPSTGVRSFSPPPREDWVLVIDNQAANLVNVWDEPTSVVAETRPVLGLEPPFPNPFNPRTEIVFMAPEGQRVRLRVFDARGRRIADLFEGSGTGTRQSVVWNAMNIASGTYFVRLESTGDAVVRKLAVMR